MYRKHLFTAIAAAVLFIGAAPAWAEMDGTANEEAPLVGERYSQYDGQRRPDARFDQRYPVQRGEQRIQGERGDIREPGQRGNARNYQGRGDPRDLDRRADPREYQSRIYQGRDYDRGAYYQPGRGDYRGAGPAHQFRRGDRLPYYYRSSSYVVDDWRGHRLSAPPPGQHWVQTGSDYVLIAITTGLILQILLAN